MNVLGLSPFEPAGDSVSKYNNILYYEDVVSNTRSFNDKGPIYLVKAYSNSIEGKDPLYRFSGILIYISTGLTITLS